MSQIISKNAGEILAGTATEKQLHPIHPITPIETVTCSIGLDSYAIQNTRSLRKDTDFVTVSLAVGTQAPRSLTRSLGDVDNGSYPLDMIFSNVKIGLTETAILTYTMVNNGHQAPGAVEQALEKGTETLAGKAAQIAATAAGGALGTLLGAEIGTAAIPIIGTALGALAGYIVGDIFGLIFANCDGPVAAAVHAITGEQIKEGLAKGSGMVTTDNHPGVDSADGCGSNSRYTVTWSVR